MSNPHISFPYSTVMSVTFDGEHDDDEPGYVTEDKDTYLKGIRESFITYMRFNYHSGMRIGGWEIIKDDIIGPGSSGYPNSLEFIIGVWPAWSPVDVIRLINSFKG
jgi:hypothetical protein